MVRSASPTNPYVQYYVNQVGQGLPVFRGTSVQHGRGFGQVIGSLFRSAVPLLKRGAVALGKKALTTGVRVVDDVVSGKNFKSSVASRAKEGAGELVKEAIGKRKHPSSSKRKQSRSTPYAVKKHKRKRAPPKALNRQDVFSD